MLPKLKFQYAPLVKRTPHWKWNEFNAREMALLSISWRRLARRGRRSFADRLAEQYLIIESTVTKISLTTISLVNQFSLRWFQRSILLVNKFSLDWFNCNTSIQDRIRAPKKDKFVLGSSKGEGQHMLMSKKEILSIIWEF